MADIDTDRNTLAWRTATRSEVSNCVEVARYKELIAVRNSKRPEAELILYTQAEFSAFLDGARKGEFDDLLD